MGKFLTRTKVIEQFEKIHQINGVPKYNYSKFIYKSHFEKGIIICSDHGEFLQNPNDHKGGSGCPKCGIERRRKLKTLSQKDVIKQFKEIHNINGIPKYNYDNFIYSGNMVKGLITCKIHGDFEQKPNDHKQGFGCPDCGGTKKLNRNEVIAQFKAIHTNENFIQKYDYTKFKYINNVTKGIIICKKHGEFLQPPYDHKRGIGCPQCKSNKPEEFIIELFKEYNINYDYNNRNLIGPLEIDFYLNDFKFGIEHNGLFWHSYGNNQWGALDNYHKLDKNKHLHKTIKMEEQGCQLFHIREDHLLDQKKKEIWKSILLNKCGFSHKVHARKLQVVNLNGYTDFVAVFLENNHLQGPCPASIKLGLQDPKTGIVYSIMTFGKSRFDKNIEYELLRFCNLRYHNVRGAASKLLKAFERAYKPQSIVSYANRDWSQGNLYKAIGFEYSHTTEPNYFYVDSNFNIIKRQQAQKHKLKSFLEIRNGIFNENLSERDNMINNGYRIYYDTGNLVYHKKY